MYGEFGAVGVYSYSEVGPLLLSSLIGASRVERQLGHFYPQEMVWGVPVAHQDPLELVFIGLCFVVEAQAELSKSHQYVLTEFELGEHRVCSHEELFANRVSVSE